MTERADLARRRAELLPLYANPNHDHEMQWLEVRTELDWIAERLRDLPPDPEPPKPMARRHGNRYADRATGTD